MPASEKSSLLPKFLEDGDTSSRPARPGEVKFCTWHSLKAWVILIGLGMIVCGVLMEILRKEGDAAILREDTYTVHADPWRVLPLTDKSLEGAHAFGQFVPATNDQWSYLQVESAPTESVAGYLVAQEATGYLEGYLTWSHVRDYYTNYYYGMFGNKQPEKLTCQFIAENWDWTIAQAEKQMHTSAYWLHVRGVLAQQQGLMQGYLDGSVATMEGSHGNVKGQVESSTSTSDSPPSTDTDTDTDTTFIHDHNRRVLEEGEEEGKETSTTTSSTTTTSGGNDGKFQLPIKEAPKMTQRLDATWSLEHVDLRNLNEPTIMQFLLLSANGDLFQIMNYHSKIRRTSGAHRDDGPQTVADDDVAASWNVTPDHNKHDAPGTDDDAQDAVTPAEYSSYNATQITWEVNKRGGIIHRDFRIKVYRYLIIVRR
jgi:hypothetical protein